jgi:hypothetical protein
MPATVEVLATTSAPTAVENGTYFSRAPRLRSRETHSQSDTMTSTLPPRSAIRAASGDASSVTASATPCRASSPWRRMVSISQDTVPVFCSPSRSGAAAMPLCIVPKSAAAARNHLRPGDSGPSCRNIHELRWRHGYANCQ